MSTPGHSQFHNAQEKTCRTWPISLSELIPTTLSTKLLHTCLRSDLWVVLSVSRVFALTFLLFSYNALSSQSFKVGFSPCQLKYHLAFYGLPGLHPSRSLQLIHFLLGTDVFICLLFCRALIYLHLFESKFYLSVVEHAFNPTQHWGQTDLYEFKASQST